MIRALLVAALLVASVAPAWAQSDGRWIAIFAPGGTLGKGGDRYGDPTIPMGKNPAVVETMLRRMAIPYKVILLPDSAGGWARQVGDERDTDEADSTHFRKNGCMGWISYMESFSFGTALKTYSGEIAEVFTDANGNTGVHTGSPLDGNWGIPGVMFVTNLTNAGGNTINGIVSNYGLTGHSRNRSLFADNGDSLSTDNARAYLPLASQAENFNAIIRTPDYDASGDSLPVAAWRYKTNTLYYSASVDPYLSPTMLMLGLADLINRAGYKPRRKLNLHMDLDHPYPDSRPQGIPTAPSDSLFAYIDAQSWRYGSNIEAHSTEIADDDPVLAGMWKSRSAKWPAHPHSHNYLNFGSAEDGGGNGYWDFSAFSDSATKRARWNDMEKQIADTLRHTPNRGYEKTATFPNNDVQFPDLYIMAGAGYRDIRSRAFATATSAGGVSTIDSIGVPKSLSLKRWQQVPGPRVSATTSISKGGLPYMYIEPKTNLPLWIHDSVESPTSSDSVSTAATNYSVSMEGFASRSLSSMVRMAIFDGGHYWHPDLNVANCYQGDCATNGPLMAALFRRLTYFYGRTKNILDISPIYRPKTPRTGGTARSSYSDNR